MGGSVAETVSPSATTLYDLTVSDPSGSCANAVDQVLITVISPPATPNASASPINICAGDTVNLSATCSNPNSLAFSEDFDPIDASQWLFQFGGTPDTLCGSISGNAYYFDVGPLGSLV